MKAAFKFDSFKFPTVSLDFNFPINEGLEIIFNPKGKYNVQIGKYYLTFETLVQSEETKFNVVKILCEAEFSFMQPLALNDIPDFFYPNSLAILFPYIRAFVSTVSIQANVSPIVLPTLNLTGLKDKLKNNTVVVE